MSTGRKVMAWERALGWEKSRSPAKGIVPVKGLVLTESGDYGENYSYVTESKKRGYPVFFYDPNPGIEHLFLPYYYKMRGGKATDDCLVNSHRQLSSAATAGVFDGMINTSWDDSGLHNQCWMPRFVCAAEFSWKAAGRDVETWARRYFASYHGPEARDLRELFQLLQDGALFYYDTFQRRVWHWGDVGKVHLPDLPRGGLEYDGFWRRRYAGLLQRARSERQRIARAMAILDDNLSRDVRRRYDLEVMRTCAELMRHNVDLVLMLGDLEEDVATASAHHFSDRREALSRLQSAARRIEEHLADRQQVFEQLLGVWERTRLPKGLSLPDKPFVHARDRARHFANRTPDMSYLVLDEQLLGLEAYLADLKEFIRRYPEQD